MFGIISKKKKEEEKERIKKWQIENRRKEEVKFKEEKKWCLILSILYKEGREEFNTVICSSEEHAKSLETISYGYFKDYLEGKTAIKSFCIDGSNIKTLINMDFVARINFTVESR